MTLCGASGARPLALSPALSVRTSYPAGNSQRGRSTRVTGGRFCGPADPDASRALASLARLGLARERRCRAKDPSQARRLLHF